MISAKLNFSSKAGTLDQLSKVMTSAKVLPVHLFTVPEFSKNKETLIKNIQQRFSNMPLVIRSSSANEDGSEFSNAGHYESVLGVPSSDSKAIEAAIKKVVASFGENNGSDEIFVQPLLSNITMAGVALTSDLDTLAPYYIINYDESGSSDSVTSGKGTNLKTFVYFKNSPVKCSDVKVDKVITSLKELENIFDHPHLDVEFAFDEKGDLYIFQVRRISTIGKEDLSRIDLTETLIKIHKKITKLSAPHPNLLGDRAIYGVMPDWNPAEIIGLKPKHLSASLYKEIITDSIWAYQRDNYGYRNLRSHPLMLLYLGVPYIDVRVDFNSFIPKKLDEKIAKKLVEYYLTKLSSTPVLHDKVEFEIVHSCFYFDLPERLAKDLTPSGFSSEEIKNIERSLLDITNTIIHPQIGLYKKDLLQAEKLEEKYQQIVSSQLSLVDKIYWLLEDCKRYGTLPFAGVARSAFIATQLLRSLVDLKILSRENYSSFIASFNTVTRKMNTHLQMVYAGEMTKKDFLETYGHLRPGTYDILSPRYDEDFETYFSNSASREHTPTAEFKFSEEQITRIDALLAKYGLLLKTSELIDFIKTAIEGRENVKFIFTRSLSKVLSLIEQLAVKYGIARHDLVYLDIKTILDLYAALDYRDVKDIFERDIDKNKKTYQYTKSVRLPGLITKADDVYFYSLHSEAPNFITMKSILSQIVKETELNTASLENKIIFIKSADPGFDFLFSKKIGGLITQFGGTNSHMAVRCAELGIPAVIGAGENNYNSWSKANVLEIDCLNDQVRIIS